MSIKKYASAKMIFDALITHYNLSSYIDLAAHINIPYQTLMAWKKRDRIADLVPFMDKGISKTWLETGEGEMFVTPITGTSKEGLSFSEKSVGTIGASPDPIRQAIERELDRMTRKQLAEALSYLIAKNEETDSSVSHSRESEG